MSNKLDLTIILPIKSSLAKDFDEPFNGPFRKIDVRFRGRFNSNESSMTFEIELK